MKQLNLIAFLMTALIFIGCNAAKKTTSTVGDATKKVSKTMSDNISLNGKYETGGKIGFEAANERYSADGKFNSWNFTKLNMKKGDIESVDATLAIDLTSIWEKSDKLTDHLKAPDFFNIDKFTTATIDIKNVRAKGDAYTADMVVKMKGITQELTSDFKVTSMNPPHVTGTAQVSRQLFGLGSDEMGVGEFVKVTYDTDLPQGE